MEKKTNTTTTTINDDSESLGVCRKLFTAILRISHLSREPSPAKTHHSHGVGRTIEIQNGVFTGKKDVVLVHDKRKPKDDARETSSQRKLVLIEGSTNGKNKKNPDKETDQHHHNHHHDRLNNTFEEYIKRAGFKIREDKDVDHGGQEKNMMTSGSGTDHVIKKKSSFKDHVSDYIHRAKFKIMSRSSLSAGSSSTSTTYTGKTVSFKTEY